MDRRQSITALAALLLPATRIRAQPRPLPRIGVLTLGVAPSSAFVEAFREGLRELGHVEGRTVALEHRFAQGKSDALPGLAKELVAHKVDVIVTESTAAALAAKNATQSIAVVMAATGSDPVKLGLVATQNRPGGNVTGLLLFGGPLDTKRLQLLRDTMPERKTLAALVNVASPNAPERIAQTGTAARALGYDLRFVEVRSPADLGAAFAAIEQARPSLFMTISDGMLLGQRDRVVAFVSAKRLPSIFPEREFAQAGGLMAYGVNIGANFRRAAMYVDRILRGTKPGDLPVEEPAKIDFVVNLKTAKALGVTIPPAVLILADEVIR